MTVKRKIVRRDFTDHADLEGLGYDVLAANKEPYDRDTVIGVAKFQEHEQFNYGLAGLDLVPLLNRVYDMSEIVLFDEDNLNESESKAVRIKEKISNLEKQLDEVDET